MAVTVTAVDDSGLTRSWDIAATADDDTTATITHGLGAAPGVVTLRPLKAEAYLSAWIIAVSATEITLTKATTTGSGVSGNQVRVQASLPHSIVA